MDLSNIDFSVSLEQLAYITIATIIVGSVIRAVVSFFSGLNISNIPEELNAIIERCYALFPIENINFNGRIFKRGMKVCIITKDKRKIEGEIIGANTENIICLLTPTFIITRDIRLISSIYSIDETL